MPGWGTKIPQATQHGQKIHIYMKREKRGVCVYVCVCTAGWRDGETIECRICRMRVGSY